MSKPQLEVNYLKQDKNGQVTTNTVALSRRAFVKTAVVTGSALAIGAIVVSSATPAVAYDGFLEGTWIVRCRNGHDDQVDGITRNHDCEKCGVKSVDGGTADVVCPAGHATRVGGVTRDHACSFPLPSGGICGKQCRR